MVSFNVDKSISALEVHLQPLPVGKFGSMLSKIFIDFFNEIHIDCGVTRRDTNMT
jgi:hypothetical protein